MSDMTDSSLRHPRFDPTINLGHLLTIGSVLVTLITGGAALHYRMAAVETGMASVGTRMEKLESVVIEQAKVAERLIDHGRRIDRLESWRETGKATPWSPP